VALVAKTYKNPLNQSEEKPSHPLARELKKHSSAEIQVTSAT